MLFHQYETHPKKNIVNVKVLTKSQIGNEKFTEYPKGCATVSVMSAIGAVTKASTTIRAAPPFFNSVGTGFVSVRATEVLDAFKIHNI